jgi:hypothetical protein
MSVARLEAQVALPRLIRRFPEIQLAGQPVHAGRGPISRLQFLARRDLTVTPPGSSPVVCCSPKAPILTTRTRQSAS